MRDAGTGTGVWYFGKSFNDGTSARVVEISVTNTDADIRLALDGFIIVIKFSIDSVIKASGER